MEANCRSIRRYYGHHKMCNVWSRKKSQNAGAFSDRHANHKVKVYDMVQNTVAQAILTPLQRLPTANHQHVGTRCTITTRPVTNETSIPIFKIFEHFWNMHPDNLQPNPNRRDIVWNTVGQPLLTPLSRGYVWQDVKDRVIKPVVIMNFPNSGQTNRHLNYPSEYGLS